MDIERAKKVCKMGGGADCCRYLVAIGGQGLRCGKLTGLKDMIDQRVANGTYKAMGDNCPGYDEGEG